jgi:hypothetical protein
VVTVVQRRNDEVALPLATVHFVFLVVFPLFCTIRAQRQCSTVPRLRSGVLSANVVGWTGCVVWCCVEEEDRQCGLTKLCPQSDARLLSKFFELTVTKRHVSFAIASVLLNTDIAFQMNWGSYSASEKYYALRAHFTRTFYLWGEH